MLRYKSTNAVLFSRKSLLKRWCSSLRSATLFVDTAAPPARFVLMTAKLLNVSPQLRNVDLFAGENRTDSFLKINPHGKVPVLVHDGITVRDSHAIALYLCCKTQNSDIYPKEPEARSAMYEMLFFHCDVMFPIDKTIMSEYFSGVKTNNSLLEAWKRVLDFIEHKLEHNCWLAGKEMNLSDLCCVSTLSSMELLVPLNHKAHPNIAKWMKRMKNLHTNAINEEGLARLKEKIMMK